MTSSLRGGYPEDDYWWWRGREACQIIMDEGSLGRLKLPSKMSVQMDWINQSFCHRISKAGLLLVKTDCDCETNEWTGLVEPLSNNSDQQFLIEANLFNTVMQSFPWGQFYITKLFHSLKISRKQPLMFQSYTWPKF